MSQSHCCHSFCSQLEFKPATSHQPRHVFSPVCFCISEDWVSDDALLIIVWSDCATFPSLGDFWSRPPLPAARVTKIELSGPVTGNPLRKKNTLWLQPSLGGQLGDFFFFLGWHFSVPKCFLLLYWLFFTFKKWELYNLCWLSNLCYTVKCRNDWESNR